MDSTPVFNLLGASKRYGAVQALDQVDLEAHAGELHALLGEPGSGRSTLLGAAAARVSLDAGELRWEGAVQAAWTPALAAARGVALIDPRVPPSPRHTALQNIALGAPGLGWMPRWSQVRAEVSALAERLGLGVPLDRPAGQLGGGDQLKIMVLRALYAGARVLLLDEPTLTLTRSESAALYAALALVRAEGKAVVISSQKPNEVRPHCQRMTLLRKGRSRGVFTAGELNTEELGVLLVGRPVSRTSPSMDLRSGQEVVSLRGVTVRGPHGRPELMNASFHLGAGQVLGVVGATGSGQTALLEVLAGLRVPSAGKMRLFGHTVNRYSAAGFARLGVAYIPEDRRWVGTAPAMSVAENLVLRSAARDFTRWGVLDVDRVRAWARGRMEEHQIEGGGPDAPLHTLSEAEVQKLILARELAGKPELILAAYPTRGLDLTTADAVRERLLNARWGGGAVVLVSDDLDEVLRMADQVLVLYGGRVMGIASRIDASRERIALWMSGQGGSTQIDLAAPSGELAREEGSWSTGH